jgi:hypothetical protein
MSELGFMTTETPAGLLSERGYSAASDHDAGSVAQRLS